MNVPILDEAWMERRRQERYWQAMAGTMFSYYPSTDTAESLREDYARGSITLEQFEKRLDRMLTKGDICPA